MGSADHDALGLVGGAPDQVGDLVRRLAPAAEDVGRDDVRVRRVGPPDADAHAVEVGAAELTPQGLQPVVPGQAAAEADAYLAELQVDLVVDDHEAIELDVEAPAGRSDG